MVYFFIKGNVKIAKKKRNCETSVPLMLQSANINTTPSSISPKGPKYEYATTAPSPIISNFVILEFFNSHIPPLKYFWDLISSDPSLQY